MNKITAVREAIQKFTLIPNSIDTLFTKKLDDFILLEEQPLPIQIGERTIFIGNFTLENEPDFFNKWGHIIGILTAKILNWDVSVERKKDLLEKADFSMLAKSDNMYEFILKDKWFSQVLVKLIGKTVLKQQSYYIGKDHKKSYAEWKNCTYAYFKKHITKEKLIQICYLIYYYNFDSVKKNLKLLMGKMNMNSLMETYIPYWLQNMDGLHGNVVQLQAPPIESIFADEPSDKKVKTDPLNQEDEDG